MADTELDKRNSRQTHDGIRGARLKDALDAVTPDSSRRLLVAALNSFATNGFHAATTRDIADRAGMSSAAVYVHYRAKVDLLYKISKLSHDTVLAEVKQALEGSDDPVDRLSRYIFVFAEYHATNHTIARVSQYELDALTKPQFRKVADVRRKTTGLLRDIVTAGNDQGVFDVPDVAGTTRAILSVCIDIARWYEPERAARPEDISELYSGLALRMVGAAG